MNSPLLKSGYYSIFLNRYRRQVSIGIYPNERAARQELQFTVRIILQRTGPTDTIEDVVDYDYIRDTIDTIVAERHFDLQETLCEEILHQCRRRDGVFGAFIRTEKTKIYDSCDGVGCEFADIDPICLL
ncbi:MAG: dihydroneopterin aldolase [bacterium]